MSAEIFIFGESAPGSEKLIVEEIRFEEYTKDNMCKSLVSGVDFYVFCI